MKTVILTALLLVGCGSAEGVYDFAHKDAMALMDVSHEVMYGSEEPTTVETPTPDCDTTMLVCEGEPE